MAVLAATAALVYHCWRKGGNCPRLSEQVKKEW